VDNRCPECTTPLLAGATRCECGWKSTVKAQGGIKCLCGRMARIQYNGFHCWDCYHHQIKGTDREDWRDKLIREKTEELGLDQAGNEPDWSVAKRAKIKLKEMGGIDKAINEHLPHNAAH